MTHTRAALFDSSKARGEGNFVIFINLEILQGLEDAHISSHFGNENKGFKWNLRKYCFENDYLWNTADFLFV